MDSKFIYLIIIILFAITIITANTTNSFFTKYGDTRKDCPQAYTSVCSSGQLCSIPECKEINLEYAEGKEITKKYYPLYSIFINKYITKLTDKLI